MADATDLKSVLAKVRYGFESHHRHPAFTNSRAQKRIKRPTIRLGVVKVFIKFDA
jgi:hypothetical protein